MCQFTNLLTEHFDFFSTRATDFVEMEGLLVV